MSTPYGMPPAAPQPPAAPRKSRTGLYIGIACGCLLLVFILVAAIGAGVWMFSRDDGREDPTAGPSTSESSPEDPSEDPTDEPTQEPTDEESEDPTDEPTDEPTQEPTGDSAGTAEFEANVSPAEEGTTLDTGTETLTTENGKFIGVEVTLTNTGETEIALGLDRFGFIDVDGTEYPLMHGVFSGAGPIEPGEEARAQLYADVPEDAELETVTYNPASGSGGQSVSMPVG